MFLLLLLFLNIAYAHRLVIYYKHSQLRHNSLLKQYNVNHVEEVNQVGNGHVFDLHDELNSSQFHHLLQKLRADDEVKAVDEDILLHKFSQSPTYPIYQWDMGFQGDNFTQFINDWHGHNYPGYAVKVAVIDTGYVPHNSYISNLLPLSQQHTCVSHNGVTTQCYGYTFISSCKISRIPNCKDGSYYPDALDFGDYNDQYSSSWHGSHVTGIISANNDHLLGGSYGAMVLPIRALGVGGGYISDIANAILWAINAYPAIPNRYPVQVINLSLGAPSHCSFTMQSAINKAYQKGVIIVVAAGNADSISHHVFNVSEIEPANCTHVISVSAKTINNDLASYSSYGNTTITASGGEINGDQVISSVWSSVDAYNAADEGIFVGQVGTSQAAPHVSAAVANLISYYTMNNLYYDFNTIVIDLTKSSTSLRNTSNYNSLFPGQGGSVKNIALDMNAAMEYAKHHSAGHRHKSNNVHPYVGGCSVNPNSYNFSLIVIVLLLYCLVRMSR